MPKEALIAIIIISSIFLFLTLSYFIFSFVIANHMTKLMCKPPHFKTKEEKDSELEQCGHRDGFDKYERKPIEFMMKDGYVIHGDKDELVFPENAQMLYSNDNGPKQLVMFEGAYHCGCVSKDKNKYYKVIEEFINQYKRQGNNYGKK